MAVELTLLRCLTCCRPLQVGVVVETEAAALYATIALAKWLQEVSRQSSTEALRRKIRREARYREKIAHLERARDLSIETATTANERAERAERAHDEMAITLAAEKADLTAARALLRECIADTWSDGLFVRIRAHLEGR